MNLEKKKEVALKHDINILMERMGYQPVQRTQRDTWYISPFRPGEESPSFHVSRGTYLHSVWKDFGKGDERSGGNIIHLIRELKGLGYKEAIEFILEHTVGNRYQSAIPFPKHKKKSQSSAQSDRHILKEVKDIQHLAIFQYLIQERNLSEGIMSKYLKQVHFQDTQTGKSFFVPGIANLKGGYEVNNQINGTKFKASIPSSSKSMSFIPADQNKRRILVFEGFIDALSLLVHQNLSQFPASVLILNSASLEKEAISFIQQKGFQEVLGYFDHDRRGRELTESFSNEFGSSFSDQSHIYIDFKDYNEFIQENPASQNGLDLAFPGSG